MMNVGGIYATLGADNSPLRKSLGEATGLLNGYATKVGAANESVSAGFSKMATVAGAAKLAVVGSLTAVSGAAILFGKSLLETAIQFEGFRTQLVTTTGSAIAAEQAFAWVKEFAKTTPYEITTVTAAFVRMKAYGIDPTGGAMRTLGDTASAMGKSIMQAVEAMADAVQGEGERLKEFGIKQQISGTKVAYTWTDMMGRTRRTVVENSPEIIKQTLLAIWNEKYAGGMERMSKTWTGMWSNMLDAVTNWKDDVMQSGVFDALKEQMQRFLDYINRLADTGVLEKWADKTAKILLRMVQNFYDFQQKVLKLAIMWEQFWSVTGSAEQKKARKEEMDRLLAMGIELDVLKAQLDSAADLRERLKSEGVLFDAKELNKQLDALADRLRAPIALGAQVRSDIVAQMDELQNAIGTIAKDGVYIPTTLEPPQTEAIKKMVSLYRQKVGAEMGKGWEDPWATGAFDYGAATPPAEKSLTPNQIKVIKQRYDMQKAEAENATRWQEAVNARLVSEEDTKHKLLLTSLDEYLKAKNRLQLKGLMEDIKTLESRKALVEREMKELAPSGDEALQNNLIKERNSLATQIKILRDKRSYVEKENDAERVNALKDLHRQQVSAEASLLAVQGDRFRAGLAQIDLEAEGHQELFKKLGIWDGARFEWIQKYKAAKGDLLRLDLKQEDSTRMLADLDAMRSSIQGEVTAGKLSELEAVQWTMEVNQRYLPLLREAADKMVELAGKTGDALKVDQAKQFVEQVKQIAVAVEEAQVQLGQKDFTQHLRMSMKKLRDESLVTMKTWADSVAEAMRSSMSAVEDHLVRAFTTGKLSAKEMVDSILADLARLAIRQAVTQPILSAVSGAIASYFGGGGAEGSGGGENPATQNPTFEEMYHTNVRSQNLQKTVAPATASAVQVNVYNNSGSEVRTASRQTPNGQAIEVYVDNILAGRIRGRGEAAKAMEQTYGLARVGA